MSSSVARNAASAIASSNACSSASIAGINVSGTYRPPNAPNRSFAPDSVAVVTLSLTALSWSPHRVAERAHSCVVLDTGRALHARRNIDDVGGDDAHRVRDVVWREPAGEHDPRAHALSVQHPRDRAPVERCPGTAE